MIEWFQSANVVAGLLVTVFGAGASLIYWFGRRIAARVTEGTADVRHRTETTAARVDAIDRDVKALRREVTEVRREQGRTDDRLARVESEIHRLPTKEDLHEIELAMSSLAGDMKALRAVMQAVHESMERQERIISRHEEHLRGGRP